MAVLPATQKSQSYDGEGDNLRDPKTYLLNLNKVNDMTFYYRKRHQNDRCL